eukprot:scaffold14498_cov121-Isochrysis_galbana.AAC.3
MKDGLLYYLSKAESTDSADLRLYIPESLRHSYMVAFHDSAGHLGVWNEGTHPLSPSLHGLSSAQGPSSPPCLLAATIAGSKGGRSGGG